jgi:uncharacterized protein YrrD
MFASKKILSLSIFSLQEGQKVGHVRSLVINAKTKNIAALVVDPQGFFQDQRIIPFARVISIGEDAITVSTSSQAERASSLPNILELLKERPLIVGLRVVTDKGKTLGLVEEYYVDPDTGNILELDISGGRIEGFFAGRIRMQIDNVLTFGKDAVVVSHDSLEQLVPNKGLNENARELWQSTSGKASSMKESFKKFISGKKSTKGALDDQDDYDDFIDDKRTDEDTPDDDR